MKYWICSFCWNGPCYCVGMVSMKYISCHKSSPSLYIRSDYTKLHSRWFPNYSRFRIYLLDDNQSTNASERGLFSSVVTIQHSVVGLGSISSHHMGNFSAMIYICCSLHPSCKPLLCQKHADLHLETLRNGKYFWGLMIHQTEFGNLTMLRAYRAQDTTVCMQYL